MEQKKSLNFFLRQKNVAPEIRSLLSNIARSVKYINFSLRAGHTGTCGTENFSGESQLKLDVLADKIIATELERSDLVSIIASEERESVEKFSSSRAKFVVAYDPLDGSSLVDSDLAIGSIFGIWAGDELIGRTGNEMEAAAYAVYGPRVVLVIAIRDRGVHEFELNDVGEFILTQSDFQLEKTSKYFAPGNLRATAINKKYKTLVDNWIAEKRTLRYSGGMVPDLHHILKKNQGIFTYPGCEKHPNGKLRLAFECAPFGFIFAEAGGLALDQTGKKILDLKIEKPHQRTTIFIGSTDEVKSAVNFLKK
ncbi:fructose-1,6-bisphosphatase [bacterium]|jgi:fructose-1,6-bisphosphatase I|nr:fructose-1,6-bisphosphatase [bacterium]MBT6831984.1 fructose-1,6-bisphosphatase [bacterium]MBT6996784.1 fructose-1,6-bisphosphatase [bacterium]MBT7772091.1 fructose-1,6-bisphosphatase [bacterium]